MATSEQCSECGANISSGERDGLCARCLLSLGLSDAVNAVGVPDEDRGSPEPQPATSFEAGGKHLNPFHTQAAAGGDIRAPGHRSFGDYDLLEEIARGGGGIVYRARQRSLNRIVAIKLLVFGAAASPEVVRRFRVEASAAGALQHPNIVAIHEVGLHQGQHYLAMDFVDGPNLAGIVRDHPLSGRRAALYMRQIAEAVHYAHERGILHRDLKPSNMLLGADDQPRVTDFGLAKRVESGSELRVESGESTRGVDSQLSTQDPLNSLTLTGQVIGSPGYMSPEQATADHARVGRASDVYSLGAILYQLLTSRAPFQGETPAQTMHQVLHTDPLSPLLLNPAVPRDLETICLKCLEKEPDKRYPTAQALADELIRFLHDEPIHARPVGRIEKSWRWCRRKPALAASFAALALALTLGFTGVLTQWQRAERHRRVAELQSHRAEDNAANERRERYYASIAAADSHIRNGDIDVALNVLTNCPPEYRHWEWGRLLYLCHQSITTARLNNQSLEMMIVNSDATRVCGPVDGAAVCWDVQSGREVLRFGSSNNFAVAMAFSPDGRKLAVARLDGQISVWDADSGREQASLTISNRVQAIHFDPDTTHLYVTTSDQRVAIWGITTGRMVFVTPAADGRCVSSALDYQQRTWVTMNDAGLITLRDARTGTPRATIQGTNSRGALTLSGNAPLVFSPDGRWLLANRSAFTARVWEVETGREVVDIPARIYSAAFSPDGRRVATLNGNNTADVWDLATGEKTLTLKGHQATVRDICFTRNGRQIVTASDDGVVKTWNADAGRERIDHDYPVDATAFSPDGRRFITTQMDGLARMWETESGRELRTWRGNWSWCRAGSFSPDGRLILTAGADRLARIWDAETGNELLTLRGHTSAIRDAVFSPDGSKVATAGWDKTCRIWDVQTGRSIHTLTGPTAGLRPVVFGPDGKWVAAAGLDGFAHVWDTATGRQLLALKGSSSPLLAIAISPDGRRIATGSTGRSIRVWDSTTGENVAVWKARSQIMWLHFSADGRRLVVLTADRRSRFSFPTIELWDSETGRQILAIPARDSLIFSAQFSPDGLRLLTGSSDRTARLWEAFPWREEAYPGNRALPLLERVREYADDYWRQRVDAESLANRTTTPSTSAEALRLPRSAFPRRDSQAGAQLVDLSDHYNVLLDVPAYAVGYELDFDSDLSALPTGVLTLSNTVFDVRGGIFLQAAPRPTYSVFEKRFLAEAVRGIRVNSRFRRFHLLHATDNSTTMIEDSPVCGYVLHYADGQEREIEVRYGRDVRDWWQFQEDSKPGTDRAVIVWRGANPSAIRQAATLRLYKTAFDNPRPDVEVRSVDFVSKLAKANPFLIALTVEP